MKKVFLSEMNMFAFELDVNLDFKSPEQVECFLSIFDEECLQKILNQQLEAENYDSIDVIKRVIEKK